MYHNGWWAKENKPIEYVFDLAPGEYTVATGYQEWWSTERGIKISAVIKISDGSQSELTAKNFTLGNYDYALVQELTFTVPNTDENLSSVIIRVEKTDSPDPVLSFIGLVKDSPSVDLSGLRMVLDLAKDKKETLYTQESWSEFSDKLSAAQTVFDDPNSTQDEIDQAKTDLQKVMDALVFDVTAENLQIMNNEVITLLENEVNNTYSGIPDDDTVNGFYSKEAYDALSEKLKEAQALLDIINGESDKTPLQDLTENPGDSETENPGDSETENPDDSKTENPDDSKTENPDDSKTENPDDSNTENPDDSKTENPDDSNTENPDDSNTENPDDSNMDNPDDSVTQSSFIFKTNCLSESKLGGLDKSEDGKSEDGKSEDGKSEDGKSEDGKSEDGKSEDGKSEDGKSEDGKSEDGKSEDGKSEDGKSEDGKSEEGNSNETNPTDSKNQDFQSERQKKEDDKKKTDKEQEKQKESTNIKTTDMTDEQAASVATMLEGLSQAKEAFLNSRYTVDVTLVNKLKTLLNVLDRLVEQDYSAESWQSVEHAIANGKAVMETDGEKYTVRAVKNAVDEITAAKANLKQISSPSKRKSSDSKASHKDDQQEFWNCIKEKILSAESGATLSIMARRFDKIPVSMLRAMRGKDITLKISWNGKEPIIIDGQAVEEIKKGQIYYRLSDLAELYQIETETSEPQTQAPVVSEPLPKRENSMPAEAVTSVPETVTSEGKQESIPAEQAEKRIQSSSATDKQDSVKDSAVPAQTKNALQETPSTKESSLSPLLFVLLVLSIAIVSVRSWYAIKHRKQK